jgi:hypothetical protein
MANLPRRQDLSRATPPSFIRITRHPDVLHDDEAVSQCSWKVVAHPFINHYESLYARVRTHVARPSSGIPPRSVEPRSPTPGG